MKKLNKKEWGILGTSLGLILIIVALLTMVGIGSNGTYSVPVTQCTCTSGTYDPTTNKCALTKTESITCVSGANVSNSGITTACSSVSSDYKCTGAGACVDSKGNYIAGCSKNVCTKTVLTSTPATPSNCTCPTGTTNDGSGTCVATVCPGGQYKDSSTGECKACTSGHFCPAGSTKPIACPENAATCTSSSFTCKTGYVKSGNSCVGTTSTCTSVGASCTLGDKAGTCIDSGSSAGGLVCKVTSNCPAGQLAVPIPGGSGYECVPAISCPAGQYYAVPGKCATCLADHYCPGGSFANNAKQDGMFNCPKDRPYSAPGKASDSDCVASGGGSSDPSNPSGGNPEGGTNDGNTGGNGGGNTGGNGGGNSGGTGGNNGNGDGNNSSNINSNPSTATKAPLVIAIIGIISIGFGTFAYFKGKKKINTEL